MQALLQPVDAAHYLFPWAKRRTGGLSNALSLSRRQRRVPCARRLNLALNTVKRYARIPESAQTRRAPQYRPTLVELYREYLRKRRAEGPAVSVLQLLCAPTSR